MLQGTRNIGNSEDLAPLALLLAPIAWRLGARYPPVRAAGFEVPFRCRRSI